MNNDERYYSKKSALKKKCKIKGIEAIGLNGLSN